MKKMTRQHQVLAGAALAGAIVVAVCLLTLLPEPPPTEPAPPPARATRPTAEPAQPARTAERPASPAPLAAAAAAPATPASAPGPVSPPATSAPPAAAAALSATAAAAPAVVPLGDPRDAVAWFKNSAVPLDRRVEAVAALGRSRDPAAVRALMAVGSDDTCYFNASAVRALGEAGGDAAVATYLRARLTAADPKVLAEAVTSLARVAGADAVADIAVVLKGNRQRPDGYQDTVCTACVRALGDLRAPSGVPALMAELRETVGRTLQHTYGTQVVEALGKVNDAVARPALLEYIARLTAEKDGMPDNPMGQSYLEDRIRETRRVVDALPR